MANVSLNGYLQNLETALENKDGMFAGAVTMKLVDRVTGLLYEGGRGTRTSKCMKDSEEYLTFAFEHCHRAAQQNKRLILIYLLPVKMLLGQMPKQSLLRKYDLLQFADVATAVSSGNLRLLNDAMEKSHAFFIKCGIYLILEKLKIITYRNLFKKV
ncbi:hypothetical protein CAPTEDRAFT_210790 [Capitella teleta]|uniref:PCI domain-containing protein n=1 Tax=Capitella teleta TaxID=283909 RepID=R7TFT1_CAPTE|nr:hypothetical protein CAPTEDRAFT_210790 [Capitella teleta]|eukprot:ELT92327.1 hypothetical protein CAPTEDRAFT_210790 [Capitella teleta]